MPFTPRLTTPDGRPYKLFFVCGHMRSGTNWTAAVLNLHPQINCQGEGPFGHLRTVLDQTMRNAELYSSQEPMRTIMEEGFHDIVRRTVIGMADRKPYARWVGDNTSRQLWPYVPGTHHFYVLRDGRDVLTSWTFHQMRLGVPLEEPYRSELMPLREKLDISPRYFSEHPAELFANCEHWVRRSAAVWRDFALTAQHVLDRVARGRMDAKVHTVRYESLLADFEKERAAMYSFLGLDPSEADSAAHDPKAVPGFTQNNVMSFYRSGKAGDWKQYGTEKFCEWFKAEAGEALVWTGYEKDQAWSPPATGVSEAASPASRMPPVVTVKSALVEDRKG